MFQERCQGFIHSFLTCPEAGGRARTLSSLPLPRELTGGGARQPEATMFWVQEERVSRDLWPMSQRLPEGDKDHRWMKMVQLKGYQQRTCWGKSSLLKAWGVERGMMCAQRWAEHTELQQC